MAADGGILSSSLDRVWKAADFLISDVSSVVLASSEEDLDKGRGLGLPLLVCLPSSKGLVPRSPTSLSRFSLLKVCWISRQPVNSSSSGVETRLPLLSLARAWRSFLRIGVTLFLLMLRIELYPPAGRELKSVVPVLCPPEQGCGWC